MNKAPERRGRDGARQKLLEEIKQKIVEKKDAFYRVNLYRVFHHMLKIQIGKHPGEIKINLTNLPSLVRYDVKKPIFYFFLEILEDVRKSRNSEEEEKSILAHLFVWTANEIAQPYHTALAEKERNES